MVLAVFALGALFAPVLSPYHPNRTDVTGMLARPSWAHPMGTDELGRDLLSRVLHSGRISLGLEAVAAARAMEKWHPLDVRALHALGGSLAALALQGGPDGMAEAAAVLDRGARADWSYRPLLETRLTVATLRKDARAKADTEARLARLDAMRR